MWKHFFAILTILRMTNLSVQQSCKFYCLSDALSDENCVNKTDIDVNSIIHETEGSVDFQFDFGCNVKFYKIIVSYSKGNCDSANDFKQHSIYTFKKLRYSNKRYNKKIEKCAKKGQVLLQNIQTGCYYIDIIDKNYYVLYENYSYWQTLYKRQEVEVLKTTKTTYGSRNNGTELIFTIQNPILKFHPEFSLQFECDNCPKHLSKEHLYHLLQDETDSKKLILNPKDNNTHLNISCGLEQNILTEYGKVICFISPVTFGNYNIVINFLGDPYKCSYNEPQLIRFQNIVIATDELLLQPLTYFQSETIFGSLLATICILLLCFTVFLIIKLTKVNIREFNNENTNYLKENSNTVHEDHGLCVNEPKPSLMLLYARNSEEIMTSLSSLRNIFIYQGFEVFDIYDPDRLSEINENNFNWILNLTSRKDTKIILFLTPGSRNFSDLPEIQNSVDTLFPFAIKKLIQLSSNIDFDKKIFVAYFSNDFYAYPDYDLFCPHLRFRVPDDFFTLLQSISNTTEISLNHLSNNEYNKFKQNYEKHKCSLGNI